QDRQEGRSHDVSVDAHTKARWAVTDTHFHVSGSAGFSTGTNGVLVVVHDLDGQIQGIHKGRDRAFARALQGANLAVVFHIHFNRELLAAVGVRLADDVVLEQLVVLFAVQVLGFEN